MFALEGKVGRLCGGAKTYIKESVLPTTLLKDMGDPRSRRRTTLTCRKRLTGSDYARASFVLFGSSKKHSWPQLVSTG